MAKRKVAAVVVTYNRKALLRQCIQKIQEQQETNCAILIVDNASTDGTGEMVEALTASNVFYKKTSKNIGGAGGFCFGLKWAAAEGYQYAWIMDDDTLPEPNALQKLLEADELLRGNYGFLASVVLWKDGHECRMNRQKAAKTFYEHIELLREGILKIEQATFVSLLIPIHTVEQVGLPIRDFFIWGDDLEYTRRIAVRKRLPCYLVGQSCVIHAMQDNVGASLSQAQDGRISRYRYAYRNENYTYRQEGVRGFIYYLARSIREIGRILCKGSDKKAKRVGVLLLGMFQGFVFHPHVEKLEEKPNNEHND